MKRTFYYTIQSKLNSDEQKFSMNAQTREQAEQDLLKVFDSMDLQEQRANLLSLFYWDSENYELFFNDEKYNALDGDISDAILCELEAVELKDGPLMTITRDEFDSIQIERF